MAISVYKLLDQNQNPIVLFVPRFSGSERKPYSTQRYTIASATADLPEQFDHTATFFVTSQTIRDNLISQGFTNVVLTSEHVNDVWTFDNGAYIDFTSNGATVHIPNGGGIGLTAANESRTFPSDQQNTDWISGVVGYYGRLNSVGADFFTFNYYYPQNLLNETDFNKLWTGNTPFEPPSDPYEDGGTTDGTGGSSGGSGGGDFDHTSDPIDIPNLPTLSAADTGFITLFNPSAAQLRDLANYMWSNPLFDLDAWKKIFADPMDAVLGLSIVPVDVPSGGSAAVTVGNISTGVSMTKASAQYVEVDCGSLNVKEFWGAYLDYAPYTKCEINLPYCGIHPIDIDDIMGKTVTVKYHIDILSGACCAYVKCGDSVLYEFVGQCAASIPITGDNWTNVINGVMQIAASVGSMVATGGLAAPVTGANAAASIGQAVAIDANIASTIMSMKPSIEKSGSLGGVGGMLAIQKPYLILTRPKQALPANQNKYTGYPSFITFTLSDLEGYTEIEQIHLENVPATNAELDEIVTLLKGGVIL